MAITSVGTGSGLELESLLKQVLDAERAPAKTRLDLKKTTAEASISVLGTLKSTFADFQASLTKLKTASSFSGRTAVSGDNTLFTATAKGTAELSSYNIGVINLAKAHKLASANFAGTGATTGGGTLTIGVGTNSFNVEISAGVNDSLVGIRDAINNAPDNAGVRASLLTVSDGNGGTATKLVLTAKQSGAASAITVSVADADGNNTDAAGLSRLASANLSEVDPAQDALITIDGFEVRSASNVFTDAIEGVTITALKGSPVPEEPLSASLTVAADKTGLKTSIESFVANYNALITVFNQLTNYDPATKTRGLLSGDASMDAMEAQLKRVINGKVEGAATGLDQLSLLGISTNKDGSIKLDSDKLTATINTRFDDLSKLFAGDNGLASKLDKMVTGFLSSKGAIAHREQTLQDQLETVKDQQSALDLRLEKLEKRYRSQFSALDILVQQLNQTGNFLGQQLEATAQIINGKK